MQIFDAIADAVEQEGASWIFGVMGDGNMSLWSRLAKSGKVRILPARNEAGAVGMADGYFRATQKPGLATVTCGPGLTQIGTSLLCAARNRSAIVVLCGEIPAHAPNQLQALDQRRFVTACETRYLSISGTDALADEVRRAFEVAQRDSCPVVLNLPNHLQELEMGFTWHYRPSAEYLPSGTPEPSSDDLARLTEALRKAERPLLLAGRGARHAKAGEALRKLATHTGALLGTSLQSKGMFSDDDWSIGVIGGYSCATTEALCRESDLVLGFGARIGHYTSWGGTLFPHARVFRIDTACSPGAPSRFPVAYVRADARRTAERLLSALSDQPASAPRFRTPGTAARLKEPQQPFPPATDRLDPRILARALGAYLQSGGRLTCGVAHFQGFVAMYTPIAPGVDTEFVSQFGAVGQALPVALGIGAAEPDRQHLVVEGDGSLMMNLQEVETAARSGLNLTLLVWNDEGYGAESIRLPLKGFTGKTAKWHSLDFASLARSVGGDGVEVRNETELHAALAKAGKAQGLFVIDARVSQTEVSDSYRKLYFNEPNRAPLLR